MERIIAFLDKPVVVSEKNLAEQVSPPSPTPPLHTPHFLAYRRERSVGQTTSCLHIPQKGAEGQRGGLWVSEKHAGETDGMLRLSA